MANPLVKAGVKLAVKGGKKLVKKIKQRRNSTDNMSSKGPIDKAIKKGKPTKTYKSMAEWADEHRGTSIEYGGVDVFKEHPDLNKSMFPKLIKKVK